MKKKKKPKITKKTIALKAAGVQELKGLKRVRGQVSVRKDQALLVRKRIGHVVKAYNMLSKILAKVLH